MRIKECKKPKGFGGDGVTTPTPFNSFDAEVQGAVAVINDGISLMVRQWFAKP